MKTQICFTLLVVSQLQLIACGNYMAIDQLAAPAPQQSAPVPREHPATATPAATPHEPAVTPQPIVTTRRPGKGGKRFESLEAMQEEYFSLFRTKPGFGASRILTFPVEDQLLLDGFTYRFAAPDLIGLEDEPLAYQRRLEMISMAELTNRVSRASLKTRPLTTDETRAVAELRAGKNIAVLPIQTPVVTVSGINEVAGLLAVGALRARIECAQCHQCAVGTLLGAFSYRLVPTNAPANTLARARARQRGASQFATTIPPSLKPLSLTPTLSRWEREPLRPLLGQMTLSSRSTLPTLLPLLAGEGRGEGERENLSATPLLVPSPSPLGKKSKIGAWQ